jgi:hypothetical protein
METTSRSELRRLVRTHRSAGRTRGAFETDARQGALESDHAEGAAPSSRGLGRQPRRNVLIEQFDRIVVTLSHLLVVSRVHPVVARPPGAGIIGATSTSSFTGTRSQSGPCSHRVTGPPLPGRSDHRSPAPRRRRTRGARPSHSSHKIGCHDIVASLAQLGLDQVPVPSDVARAVDQDERGHPGASLRASVPPAISSLRSPGGMFWLRRRRLFGS